MDILENDDQVAAVLAHEVTHAVLEHGVSTVVQLTSQEK